MEDERTRNQLTDLFRFKDDMKERMSAIELIAQNHEKMIEGINATNQRLEKCHADAQIALFGDDKLGKKGLVKTVARIEKFVTYATISGVVLWVIVQNMDTVTKVFN